LTSLEEIRELLAAHPGFRVIPVKQHTVPNRSAMILGCVFKGIRRLTFGAEFSDKLTLLWYRLRQDSKGIMLDLFWHTTGIPADWWVFLHFVDEAGETRFQGDYSFAGASPSPFGFLYLRRTIELPGGLPGGIYRLRLGVWTPAENRHIPLTRIRGCARESAEWCNALNLDSFTI